MWDVIIPCQSLSIVRFTTCWGSCDQNFNRVKFSVFVKFFVKKRHVSNNTLFTVPREFKGFEECLSIFSSFFFLFWCQLTILKNIRSLNFQIYRKEIIPVCSMVFIWLDVRDLLSTNSITIIIRDAILCVSDRLTSTLFKTKLEKGGICLIYSALFKCKNTSA